MTTPAEFNSGHLLKASTMTTPEDWEEEVQALLEEQDQWDCAREAGEAFVENFGRVCSVLERCPVAGLGRVILGEDCRGAVHPRMWRQLAGPLECCFEEEKGRAILAFVSQVYQQHYCATRRR
jgi:hypothetical protein